jgi:hypothetical protein
MCILEEEIGGPMQAFVDLDTRTEEIGRVKPWMWSLYKQKVVFFLESTTMSSARETSHL